MSEIIELGARSKIRNKIRQFAAKTLEEQFRELDVEFHNITAHVLDRCRDYIKRMDLDSLEKCIDDEVAKAIPAIEDVIRRSIGK